MTAAAGGRGGFGPKSINVGGGGGVRTSTAGRLTE